MGKISPISVDFVAPLERAAAAARLLFPFDEMWVLLSGMDTESNLTFATRGGDEEDPPPLPSSRLPELEAGSPLSDELGRRGIRSLFELPLRGNERTLGCLGFGSRRAAAFGAEEERLGTAVADLLASLLENERALSFEREGRRRLESIAKLLPTVASTLDIRDVFQQVSSIAKEVIPHDAIGIQLIQPDRKTIVAYVVTERRPGAEWDYEISREIDENDMTDGIVEDVWSEDAGGSKDFFLRARFFSDPADRTGREVVAKLDAKRSGLVREHGFHSFLRVVLWRSGEKIGALVFASARPGQFHPGQFEAARRIAEHVSMALAHRHLAEEAERAAEARARTAVLEGRVQELVEQAEQREGFHRCVGESLSWKEVLKQATRVASTDTTVLLTGESGTGKEVVARFIHRGSPRSKGPLVAVNCAALPEQLLESELFGYERGAFSGALSTKPGRIEQAAHGVLFLDEIGEMSLSIQAKLLRVLQEREFQRLGGTRTLKADVRVIAATNRNLVAALKRNEFREDLFYRLRVFEIRLPPLRERPEDILPLTETFLADLEKTLGRRTAGLSREAREILLSYDWPGNIRELRNALERAVILCDGGLITGEQLPLGVAGTDAAESPVRPEAGMNLDSAEKSMIEKALRQARNNKSRAARLLGLSRAQLYFRLEKYGLAEPPR